MKIFDPTWKQKDKMLNIFVELFNYRTQCSK